MASEENTRKEFLELEHRFLRVMQETILTMHHSAPVQPQLLPQPQPFLQLSQPQHNGAMYHFDLSPCNQDHDDYDSIMEADNSVKVETVNTVTCIHACMQCNDASNCYCSDDIHY